MAHIHTFKVGDTVVETGQDKSADRGHIHTVKLPDGKSVTTSAAGDSPQHTHTVTVDGASLTSSSPKNAQEGQDDKQGDTKREKATLQGMIRSHNAAHPKRKVAMKTARAVWKRGEDAYSSAARPGVSREAWGLRRVAMFLKLAAGNAPADATYTHDNDLLPSAHPLKRSADGAPDPWSSLASKEAELAEMQSGAIKAVTRASARKMIDAELATAHASLAKIHATSFAGNDATDAGGVQRAELVRAAAVLEEELERRQLMGDPGDNALFAEATKARELHVRRATRCKVLELPQDGTFLELPGGPILILNTRGNDISEDLLEKSAERWSPDGSRFHEAMRYPNELPYSIPVEMSAEDVQGGVEVDEVLIERGARTDGFEELFVSQGKRLRGILHLTKTSAIVMSDCTPYVLSADAVEKGWLPEDGEAGIPATLQLDIPPAFRYWKAAEDADPVEIRDALVASGIMDHIGLVKGEFRRLSTKTVVFPPYPVAPAEFANPELPTSDIEQAAALVSGWDGVVLLEAKSLSDAAIEHISGSSDDYLISVPLADGVVKQLESLGRPFMLDGCPETVFATSVPLAPDAPVEWQDGPQLTDDDVIKQAQPAKTQTLIFSKEHWDRARAIAWAKGHDFRADKVDETEQSFRLRQRDPGDFQPGSFRTISVPGTTGIKMVVGRLKKSALKEAPKDTSRPPDEGPAIKVAIISKGEDAQADTPVEKRLVYGVVLAPETVDAQGDIYSADTIEEACHKYNVDARNIGLQHKVGINDQAHVVESYIAPMDFPADVYGKAVKKGSWIMVMKIISDTLWKAFKDGTLGGFSIGGYAVRKPEYQAAA